MWSQKKSHTVNLSKKKVYPPSLLWFSLKFFTLPQSLSPLYDRGPRFSSVWPNLVKKTLVSGILFRGTVTWKSTNLFQKSSIQSVYFLVQLNVMHIFWNVERIKSMENTSFLFWMQPFRLQTQIHFPVPYRSLENNADWLTVADHIELSTLFVGCSHFIKWDSLEDWQVSLSH